MRRPPRSAIAARGVAAAAVATFAATLGHAAGQQSLPSWWVVVVAFCLAAPVCVALAGRRLSMLRLALAVALSQIAFHLLLRLDFVGAGSRALTATHHGGAVAAALPVMPAMPVDDLDPAMLLGHALAAAATIVVLATGERAVMVLIALARRPFLVLRVAAAPRPVARPAVAPVLGIRPSLVLVGAPLRRGPPLAV